MTTSELIETYLVARRAHGVKFKTGARTLYKFAKETGDRPLTDVTQREVDAFLRGRALSATWTTKYRLLGGLYRFAIARGHVVSSALPTMRVKLPPPLTPHVYSRQELHQLIDATSSLEAPCSRLQATTYRTMLLLLYGAGLRVSEALALTLADINLIEKVLTVRDTKFYKSRLVPIGSQLTTVLAAYLMQRMELPMPQGQRSAFLSSRSGHGLDYQRVVTLFQRVRSTAGIQCPPGETRPPRLHDLRHTAAVHRVVAWYREGKDVQQLLPRLATYLGDASIASTQRYLQMTPELLQEASRRFDEYAQIGVEQEVDHA